MEYILDREELEKRKRRYDMDDPREAREFHYQYLLALDTPLILYQGGSLTVDMANLEYMRLLAEGETDEAAALSARIADAKGKIRALYPKE